MVVPAVIAGGAALAAGGLNYIGGASANRRSQKIAREQMAFQKESVGEQMQWQERMSNTAYQRAMADMQKAGLNPMLAYQQGGASTPSGSSASGASANQQNELAGAVSSALDMKRMLAEVDNLHAQNSKIKADTEISKVEHRLLETQIPGAKAEQKIDETLYGAITRLIQRLNPIRLHKR